MYKRKIVVTGAMSPDVSGQMPIEACKLRGYPSRGDLSMAM
jgi:hypothetical protein